MDWLKNCPLERNRTRRLGLEQLEVRQVLSCNPTASVCFAAVGDFGAAGRNIENVAELIDSWDPDFVVSLGDNNYPDGEAATIDENVGQYFHDYIAPYTGDFGAGASTNRFFPALGNHDWRAAGAQPYLDYFTLPGNERYYNFVKGPVELFVLDSDSNEPDGITEDSDQAIWLQNALAASTAKWKIVAMHHAPFTSGQHGSSPIRQWPFEAWGASAVLSAHDHNYERLVKSGFPYFVNGAGGNGLDPILSRTSGSKLFYSADFGAMLIEAADSYVKFQFITVDGVVVDSYTIGTPPASVIIDAQLKGGANDAEEAPNGDVSLNSSDLELVLDQGGEQTVGLRFEDIRIPQGATILSAYLQFTADEDDSQETALAIRGHDVGNAAPFTNDDFGISSRQKTSAKVTWQPPRWEAIGDSTAVQRTPELAGIVQEIVDHSDWNSGNALALLITGSGQRVAVAQEGNSSATARLHIEYAGAAPVKVKQTIDKGKHDAEEATDGTIRLSDSKLEMVRKKGENQLVGLRFKKLNIPQGATIQNAWIQFTAAKAKNSDSTLTLRGHDIDHAASFTDENGDISSRNRTSANVTWSPPAWETANERGSDQRTVDISPIIEEIVNRPGWEPNNAIVIVISGVGKQIAFGFEGNSSKAPKLRLEYIDNAALATSSATSSAAQSGLRAAEIGAIDVPRGGFMSKEAWNTKSGSQVPMTTRSRDQERVSDLNPSAANIDSARRDRWFRSLGAKRRDSSMSVRRFDVAGFGTADISLSYDYLTGSIVPKFD